MKILFLTFLFLLSLNTSSFSFFGKKKELDKKRVELINEFATQVELYYERKGHYPLGNGFVELPAVVYMNPDLKKVDYPIHYNNVTVYDYEILVKDMKRVLGDEFKEFKDPVSEYKNPSKYITKYYLGGNTFLIAANMSSSVDLSNHNTFQDPKEKQYENRSKIKEFVFYPGFMHRYSLGTITDSDHFVFSIKDYNRLKGRGFKIRKDPKKLYEAIGEKNYEKVEQLIKYGVDVNPLHRNFNLANSPLIFAVKGKDFKMVKLLIELGADVNARGGYHDPVLIYALGHEEVPYDIVELLVQHRANVNTPNYFGISPFIGVCKTGDVRLVKLFIKNGADLNSAFFHHDKGKFRRGYSPIEAAIESEQMEVIKILVANGVDLTDKIDNTGHTPLEFAKENEKDKAVEIIETLLKENN